MNPTDALKKNGNAEGTHATVGSNPAFTKRILKKIQKKLEQTGSIAQIIQKNTFHLNTSGIDSASSKGSFVSPLASEKSSKPNESFLSPEKGFMKEVIKNVK